MYAYNDFDTAFLATRNAQFRAQVERRIDGSLTEDEFKPLRLMNGLYLQLHAYMLRVAIPYGTLNSAQMRQLAMISERWDKGYGHFTTRQNIQYNWPKLKDVPDMLDALADVEMHAIQTSGNTIRNVTADHFAGAAADAAEDRAVVRAHDIGLQIIRNDTGEVGFQVIVGGGLGRTPMVGKVLRDFLPKEDLLPYCEAIVSVYNLLGRRDNKYKARIKITVHENGLEKIQELVEDRFKSIRATFSGHDQTLLSEISAAFAPPAYAQKSTDGYEAARLANPAFRSWTDTNLTSHKQEGYAIVSISIKKHGNTPGDASSDQMRVMAELAEAYGHNELRISHEQNVILPHVHKADLPAIYQALRAADLATANIGLVSDIIACPGMDYCALATARSIPIAQQIATRFDELKIEHDIGELKIKISGCINACGHHHVGHIGILGLDRAGVENYQITLGGDGTQTTSIGERAGPGFSADEIVPAIERLVTGYMDLRTDESETFLQTYRRLGMEPFKTILYPAEDKANAA